MVACFDKKQAKRQCVYARVYHKLPGERKRETRRKMTRFFGIMSYCRISTGEDVE